MVLSSACFPSRPHPAADSPELQCVRKSETQVAMVACAVPTCHAFLCEECATETEWELEGCCDEQ
jgi:hypothetical protein